MENINELKKTFERRNFYTIKDSGKIFLYALFLPLLVGFAFTYVCMGIISATGRVFEEGSDVFTIMFNEYPWFAILTVSLTELVFLCLYFCYNRANRIKVNSVNVHFKKINWWTFALSAFVGIVCMAGLFCLIEGCFGKMFDVLNISKKPEETLSLPLNNGGWYVANLIILGILPAICEELIFRGVIFQGLKERFSKWASVLLSALLFALMHQNIEQFLYPFLLGCVLAIVMDRTNNLIYPIIIHLFNNWATITLSFLNETHVLKISFNITWWFVLISVVLAGLTVLLLWVIDKFYLSKHKKVEVEQMGQTVQSPPTSVGKLPVSIICGIFVAFLLLIFNIFI